MPVPLVGRCFLAAPAAVSCNAAPHSPIGLDLPPQDRLGECSGAAASASSAAAATGGDDMDLAGFEEEVGASAPTVSPVPEAHVHSARGERVLYEVALADLEEVCE